MIFGDKLIMLRRERGYSQEQLANFLDVSRQSVSKWEAGQSTPEINKLIALADIFNVNVDSLIREDVELPEIENRQVKSETTNDNIISHKHGYTIGVNGFGVYEYKSKKKVFGIPLVHVKMGYGAQVAKGIIAIGNISVGFISIGGISMGGICLGGLGLGLLTLAGLALGGIAIGGGAIGIIAMGGMAIGVYSLGGLAIASEVAIGGAAFGSTAIGEATRGDNVLQASDVVRYGQIKDFILLYHSGIWKPLLKALSFFGELVGM